MEENVDDIDDIFAEYEEIIEGEERGNAAEGATGDGETPEVIAVPKKRVVRNPRVKFDADRLCGERGLPILVDHFKDIKFKGKGHELENLNHLLASLEHWTHRLFPSMRFQDCLAQIEKLGSKRPVQTCVQKIRLDMPILSKDFVSDDENDDIARLGDKDDELAESAFDRLLNDQRELENLNDDKDGPSASVNPFLDSLTDEQKARIERNKRLAAEKLRARKEAMNAENNSGNGSMTDIASPSLPDELHNDQTSAINSAHSEDIAHDGDEMVKRSKKRLRVESSSDEEVSIDDLVEESLGGSLDQSHVHRPEKNNSGIDLDDGRSKLDRMALISTHENDPQTEVAKPSCSYNDKSPRKLPEAISVTVKDAPNGSIGMNQKQSSEIGEDSSSDEDVSIDDLVETSALDGTSEKDGAETNGKIVKFENHVQSAAERIQAKFKAINSQSRTSGVNPPLSGSSSRQEVSRGSSASPLKVSKRDIKRKRLQPVLQIGSDSSSDDDALVIDMRDSDMKNEESKNQESAVEHKSSELETNAVERILAKFKSINSGNPKSKENGFEVVSTSDLKSSESMSMDSRDLLDSVSSKKPNSHSKIESSSSDEDVPIGDVLKRSQLNGNNQLLRLEEPNESISNGMFKKSLENGDLSSNYKKKSRTRIRVESSSSDDDLPIEILMAKV